MSEIPQVSDKEIEKEVDTFVLIATDGVWDVMNGCEAVGFIFEHMNKEGFDEKELAKALVEECFKRWQIINFNKNENQVESTKDEVSQDKRGKTGSTKQVIQKMTHNSVDDITAVLHFL